MKTLPIALFNEFKKEVLYWLNYFGIKRYSVSFYFEKKAAFEGQAAGCGVDQEAMSVAFFLFKNCL